MGILTKKRLKYVAIAIAANTHYNCDNLDNPCNTIATVPQYSRRITTILNYINNYSS